MHARFAPRTEHGLAIPPRQRDCVGEECPIAEKLGHCFVDRHHLYFSRRKFLSNGDVYEDLRNDPHSIVDIARCRHDSTDQRSQHKMYNGVAYPKIAIAKRYLEESAILLELGVQVQSLAEDIDVYTDPQLTRSSSEMVDVIGTRQEKINTLLLGASGIEVMPVQVCSPVLRVVASSHGPMIPLVKEIIAA